MPQNLWSILFFLYFAHKALSAQIKYRSFVLRESQAYFLLFSACCCYADGDSLLRGKTIVTELRFVMCPFLCSCHLFWMFFFFCQSVQRNSSCSSSLRVCVCLSNCPLMKEIVLCGRTGDRICDWSLRCWSAKWHKRKDLYLFTKSSVLSFHFLSKLEHSSHSSIGTYLL